MDQYQLSTYRDLLETEQLLVEYDDRNPSNSVIKELTYNSKEVTPGTLFVCKGINFKEEYLKEAMERGAIGYVSEKHYDFADSISALIVSDVRLAMPHLAELFFNSPSEKIKLIAVGGTKGKTTTTYYIKEIIDHYLKSEGKKECGLISSIKVFDGLEEQQSRNTTPEAIVLQRHLANAVAAGLEYMVIEVSSQALKYNRVDTLTFDVGIFLNISQDHISPTEHVDFEDYFQSKMKMFKQTKQAIVNRDSDAYEQVSEYMEGLEEVSTYSKLNEQADYYGYAIDNNRSSTRFKLKGLEGIEEFHVGMPGFFNVENAMAAIIATTSLGIPVEYAKENLKTVRVPGRMEIFESKDGLITTIVDFAHNRLSYENLYPELRASYSEHHILAVFGVSGGKAYNRRKELGAIVGQHVDEVILTMKDPDMEDVSAINATIAEEISKYGVQHQMINDRAEAIEHAIQNTTKKTLVVLTGRGHKSTQKIKGKFTKAPTDIEYAEKYMKAYDANHPA